jgi:hypothetical protein
VLARSAASRAIQTRADKATSLQSKARTPLNSNNTTTTGGGTVAVLCRLPAVVPIGQRSTVSSTDPAGNTPSLSARQADIGFRASGFGLRVLDRQLACLHQI